VTKLVITLHVVAGTIALFAGMAAMSSRKGTRAHRVAGTLFVVSMLIMAVFADYLAVAMPGQIPNPASLRRLRCLSFCVSARLLQF
jgi:uncharacterized membrane protein